MNDYQVEIETATRRGQRIAAMRTGKPIPFLETAEADHLARGNSDDHIVLAMVRGQARKIPGAATFPPARQLQRDQERLRESVNTTQLAANEAQEMLGIGPVVCHV